MIDPDGYGRFLQKFAKKHGLKVDIQTIRDLQQELVDTFEGEAEDEWEDLARALISQGPRNPAKILEEVRASRHGYMAHLRRLQSELIKLQEWVVEHDKKIVVLFEGRDAAGKGGVIKRITQRLNPRVVRVIALPKPTEEERTQWYFQRYVRHLPSAGQIVLFDRSWYNRAGVERVMGFVSDAEVQEFFRTVAQFENMLVGSGIHLLKYWFSVSDEEQEFRFQCRILDPLKQWKLSPMDLESRARWEQYTKAKEEMLRRTSTESCPWHVVIADDKKKARLNCIDHLLGTLDYHEIEHEEVVLPKRKRNQDYRRNPVPKKMIVPDKY